MGEPVSDSAAGPRDASIAQGNWEFLLLLGSAWALTTAYGVVALIYGARIAAAIDLFGGLVVWPLTLYFFPRDWRLNNYLILTSCTIYVIAGQMFIGKHGGFIFFFLPVAVVPLLMFRPREWGHVACGIAIAFAGWLFAEVERLHQWASPYRPAYIPADLFHTINFIGAFFLVMGFLIVYARANHRLRLEQIVQSERAGTELRGAFDRLALSERNLSEIFNVMVEGVWITDASGQVIRHNQAAARMWETFGGTRVGVYDQADWRAFADDGRALSPDEMPSRVALRTGRAQIDVPLKIRRSDGQQSWLMVNSIPFHIDGEEGGPPAHVVTTVNDVTAARKAQRLLYQIVNGTPDWIFIKDRGHRFVTTNKAYAAAFGRTPENIVGLSDFDLGFTPGDILGDPDANHPGYRNDDDLVMNTGRTHVFDAERVTVNGEQRIFHTVKVPLFEDGSDRAFAVLGFLRDITHLKEVEERLIYSSKMASLGQMAGGIAHEINNPLAIIKSTAQVLQMHLTAGRLDPVAFTEAVNRIVDTTTRIARVVRGLRSYSRNGDEDPFEEVALKDVVDEAVALGEQRFRATGVRLEVGEIGPVQLIANPVQLSQVLIILLNNALDAVEGRGDAAWVRLEFERNADRGVVIAVCDGGPPIPAEVAEKLMQPFFTTKAAGRGTGIGLMLAQKIIVRHQGRLFLDAQAAHTRFVIELPPPLA